jgi:hypothetical protein
MSSLWIAARNTLRPVKTAVDRHLPRRLKVAAPVVQAYLGGDFETRYTLVNFPSLYSPANAHPCLYDVALHAGDGRLIDGRRVRIAEFGSVEIRPDELFGGGLPEVGMFTARIRAAGLMEFGYEHLGTVTSHFYALYADRSGSSLALVHPQTLVDAPRGENAAWRSGYLLDAARIRRLMALQVNPTAQPADVSLFLVDAGKPQERLQEQGGPIPPMGARKISWDLPAIGLTQGLFSIGARGLPTNNAKPVLLAHFADGSFCGMHA